MTAYIDPEIKKFMHEQGEGEIKFLTPRELRQQGSPEREWAWQPYIARGGITLLGGLPKVGKSTLACAIVEAVRSSAQSFLGQPVTSSPVVVLTEESSATVLDKLADSDNVHVLVREHAWPLPPWPRLVHAGVQECERTGAGLLVVDSLSFWAQFPPDKENDTGTANRAFAPLLEAAASGLGVLLPAHQRKSGGEGGIAFRGTTAITANADMLLEVERVTGDSASPHHRQLVALGRWAAPELVLIDYDPATGSWRAIGQGVSREDAAGLSWRERILAALPDTEPGATIEELAIALDADKRKFNSELSALVRNGPVKRSGEGKRGDPYRYHKSCPEKLSQPADRNGQKGEDLFLSRPLGRTETNTSPNSFPSLTPSQDRNSNRTPFNCSCADGGTGPAPDGRCTRCWGEITNTTDHKDEPERVAGEVVEPELLGYLTPKRQQ